MIQITISKNGASIGPLFKGTFQVLEEYKTVETLTAIVYSFAKGEVQPILDLVTDSLTNLEKCGGYIEKYLNSFKIVFNLPEHTKPEFLQIVLNNTIQGD